ncbi:NADH-quinone oxidoreductase subunit C/D [Thalassotalea sp. 1_MG-2023]|uniref:NADH-quinone oxidoreductase subunit C/D n=1 Tax=Thalassotalea sp. 1_MG-2023 TaxID=3062680 RepID=UPI0026E3DA38|nr:NADH-quinone oxidoreductase subunit C/D [Thalassotalea sp. 1_MG-2023]MDO6426584.1 NADH-quinone oxidoreductase subunit C/D [Thalassotalea sp. 1_MG-2023]
MTNQVDISLSQDWHQPNQLPIIEEIRALIHDVSLIPANKQDNICDDIPTVWLLKQDVCRVMQAVRHELIEPFTVCFDITAIDESERRHKSKHVADFTISYHLTSPQRNQDIRLKVALTKHDKSIESVCQYWPNANWYEREVWDMFGVVFLNHPHLSRILMPSTWQGHPLLKTHPARATEMDPFTLPKHKQDEEQKALQFNPEAWGMKRQGPDNDFMFLNLGPNHPSVHGAFRIVLQMDGEEIVDCVPDIGYHHRGAEKMGERQSWHSYIPYTDRIDYLGGVMNNFPYVMAVEKLAGIQVPERAKVARIMTAEMFRILSHLLFYGTFAQDVGALSPIFYMFVDREKLFGIVEAISGARMHPSWFRIGGLASDLPKGWQTLVREYVNYLPARLDEYDKMVMQNSILKQRTQGIGAYSTKEALEWGVTGPGLRATGYSWDLRKQRPYGGYDQFDFEVPTGSNGDCYDRCRVRIEEMRQSIRIIEQCLNNMPEGPYKAEHPQTTPPDRTRTMTDIDTLIPHFINVSWGPTIPVGEVSVAVEATKGIMGYHLISDGSTMSYRTRIRTPSFAHLQMLPVISRGQMVADLIATLGSIDYVMADVDR